MKKMTLGLKIVYGFASILAILLILGIVAIINMKSVEQGSKRLADVYVPEANIGNEVERNSLLAMYAIRGYSLSEDKSFLQEGRKRVQEVKKYLAEAKSHATTFDLQLLARSHAQASKMLQVYERLIEQTEQTLKSVALDRERLDSSAGAFMKNANDFLTSQKFAYEKESSTNAGAKKLKERFTKVSLISEIIDLGNDARVKNFKAQALDDVTYINSALENFPKMYKDLSDIRKITYAQTNINELNSIKDAAMAYSEAMKSYVNNLSTLKRLNQERNSAAAEVLKAAQETANVAMEHTSRIAGESSHDLSNAVTTVIIGLIVALLLGMIIAYFIIRSITRPIIEAVTNIRDSNAQIVVASTQIAESATNLADGATQQASSVEEVSATIEESTALNTQTADNASMASKLATQTNSAAQEGNVNIKDLMASMGEITNASQQIAKIIKTIDEIAFQINLLALNAAVEAARAGEHGLGFAVVAEEVKSLASRSANAAKETTTIIQTALDHIQYGNKVANLTNDSFSNILVSAQKTETLIAEIAVSVKEQSEGMLQINSAISLIDEITQSNAATSEESAANSEELNAQAQAMMDSVELVSAMVGIKIDTRGKDPRKMLAYNAY